MIHQYRGHHPPCTPQMPKRPVVQAVTSTLRIPQQAAYGLHEYSTTGIAGSHAAKAGAARQASYRSQIRLWQPHVPRLQSMTTFSVGPVAPLGTGFFGWLLGYLMTMLTLSTPTNSSKSATTFYFKCEAFQVHQIAWRQIQSQLSFYIHLQECNSASHRPILGRGGKRAIVPIALPGSAVFAQQGSRPCHRLLAFLSDSPARQSSLIDSQSISTGY